MRESKFVKWFNCIQGILHGASVKKGHHDYELYNWEALEAFRLLGLMHTEISEAMQIVKRHGITDLSTEKRGKLAEELADVVIRVMDFAEHQELDVATALEKKAEFNVTRPYKFGTPHSGETYSDEQ